MFKTIGIVQAARGTKALDPKIFRKVGGKTLLERLIRRVTDCQRLSEVLVLLGGSPQDELIRALAPADVLVYNASHGDSLSQVLAAAEGRQADAVVRICADNPFVDPSLIDRLVCTAEEHTGCDYVAYCLANGRPAIFSPVGVYAEWCAVAALARADELAEHPADRVDATSFISAHPERFDVRLIPIPSELNRDDLRLKLDYEDDWEHAQVIFETLGADEFDWQQIAGLLNSQPELRQKMAALNQSHG